MHDSPPEAGPSAAARNASLAWFGAEPPEFGPSLGGGFSGAMPIRARPRGRGPWFVLKPFPAGTPRVRAAWVHAFVRHLASTGINEVPVPRETPTGTSLVTDAAGIHWELVPLVAGAVIESPTATQAAAALATLGRLHAAAAALAGAEPHPGPSPGIERRVAQARDLAARPWQARRAAVVPTDANAADVSRAWDRAIAIFMAAGGARAVAGIVGWPHRDTILQPVLRDIWCAHVLFTPHAPGQVAAIVDFHAAGLDTPATDVARLLGSWRPAGTADPVAAWTDALAAYDTARPISDAERRLVPFFHAAGVVCGLDNWFRWVCEERRHFLRPTAVLARIDRLLEDLPAALEWLARRAESRV